MHITHLVGRDNPLDHQVGTSLAAPVPRPHSTKQAEEGVAKGRARSALPHVARRDGPMMASAENHKKITNMGTFGLASRLSSITTLTPSRSLSEKIIKKKNRRGVD